MKKTLAMRAGVVLAAFALVAAPALAANPQIFLTSLSSTGSAGTNFGASFDLFDSSGTMVDSLSGILVPYSGVTDAASMIAATKAAAIAFASSSDGVTVAPADVHFGMVTPADIATAVAAAAPSAMSFATSSRSLNSAFQVSSTRAAFVSYTVDVATTLSLTGGATGTVTLQYANDSGFTSGVTTVQSTVNGNTGTLTIGLALTQTGTAAVTGMIPAGKYVKLVTANTAGTPTFTFRAAQEVLMPSN